MVESRIFSFAKQTCPCLKTRGHNVWLHSIITQLISLCTVLTNKVVILYLTTCENKRSELIFAIFAVNPPTLNCFPDLHPCISQISRTPPQMIVPAKVLVLHVHRYYLICLPAKRQASVSLVCQWVLVVGVVMVMLKFAGCNHS